MSKYYGFIGFAITTETSPDVWTKEIIEKPYKGDAIKMSRRLQGVSQLNDDISISNRISILADPFAYNNFHSIQYATFMGTKWKVSSVEVEYPRLILDLGGVYNGQTGPQHNAP